MGFTINNDESLEMKLSGDDGIQFCITTPTAIDLEKYEGPYSVTPAREAQILEIKNRKAVENIIISPIPYNYGLITWNGSNLIVS